MNFVLIFCQHLSLLEFPMSTAGLGVCFDIALAWQEFSRCGNCARVRTVDTNGVHCTVSPSRLADDGRNWPGLDDPEGRVDGNGATQKIIRSALNFSSALRNVALS